MCKLSEQAAESQQHGQSLTSKEGGRLAGSATTDGEWLCCELCSSRASLYCQADDAYLCRKCDEWVHGANFLALRHIRCLLCNNCQNLTQRYLIGASKEVVLPSIVMKISSDNLTEGNHDNYYQFCNNTDYGEEVSCSRVMKMPFLFL